MTGIKIGTYKPFFPSQLPKKKRRGKSKRKVKSKPKAKPKRRTQPKPLIKIPTTKDVKRQIKRKVKERVVKIGHKPQKHKPKGVMNVGLQEHMIGKMFERAGISKDLPDITAEIDETLELGENVKSILGSRGITSPSKIMPKRRGEVADLGEGWRGGILAEIKGIKDPKEKRHREGLIEGYDYAKELYGDFM